MNWISRIEENNIFSQVQNSIIFNILPGGMEIYVGNLEGILMVGMTGSRRSNSPMIQLN